MLDVPDAALWAVIVAANAGYFAYRWYHRNNFGARLRLRRVRRTAIRDATDGLVRLEGRVRCDQALLAAPLSDRPCIFYDVLVEDLSKRPTKPLLRQVRGLAFTIEDDTGLARVVFEDTGPTPYLITGPRDVTCAIPRDLRVVTPILGGSASRIDALLTDHAQQNPGLIFPHRLVAREGIIRPGDTVGVLGYGTHQPTATAEPSGYRTPPQQYTVTAAEGAPLKVVRLALGPGSPTDLSRRKLLGLR